MLVPTPFAIGSFNFALWDGGFPDAERQHVRVHTKPGTRRTALTALGTWGDPFEALTTAYFPNHELAVTRYGQYLSLPGTGPTSVRYAGIDYTTSYNTQYYVQNVMRESLTMHPRIVGINFDYIFAARLVCRWVLVPRRST